MIQQLYYGILRFRENGGKLFQIVVEELGFEIKQNHGDLFRGQMNPADTLSRGHSTKLMLRLD